MRKYTIAFFLLLLLPGAGSTILAQDGRSEISIGSPADSVVQGLNDIQDPGDAQDPGSTQGLSDAQDLSGVQGPGASAFYARALERYEAGDFEGALSAFRSLLEEQGESARLYYNMGNAAFRSNSIGYAILYYEKALKLEPSHRDAQHNLDYVKRYCEDSFDAVPELFLRTWVKKLRVALPERTWSMLALLLFVLFLVTALGYLFFRPLGLKKAAFFISLGSLVAFVFLLFLARSSHRQIEDPDQGIIVSPSVVVRSTPRESGNELFILHEGTRVRVEESLSDWQNIRIVDGREGWIRISDFELI